jgi:excisionase family DNA binding protein
MQRPQRQVPRYLTVQQAAVQTALSESTLRRAIKRGDLTACQPCRGRILIAQVDLEAWLRATVIGAGMRLKSVSLDEATAASV